MKTPSARWFVQVVATNQLQGAGAWAALLVKGIQEAGNEPSMFSNINGQSETIGSLAWICLFCRCVDMEDTGEWALSVRTSLTWGRARAARPDKANQLNWQQAGLNSTSGTSMHRGDM